MFFLIWTKYLNAQVPKYLPVFSLLFLLFMLYSYLLFSLIMVLSLNVCYVSFFITKSYKATCFFPFVFIFNTSFFLFLLFPPFCQFTLFSHNRTYFSLIANCCRFSSFAITQLSAYSEYIYISIYMAHLEFSLVLYICTKWPDYLKTASRWTAAYLKLYRR